MDFFPMIFVVSSLCLCGCQVEEVQEVCAEGNSQLSLYGHRNQTGQWNTSFVLEKGTCIASRNWTLQIIQNITSSGGAQHLRLQGYFADGTRDYDHDGTRPARVGLMQASQDGAEVLTGDVSGQPSTEYGRIKIIPLTEWNATRIIRSVRFWQTNSTCNTSESCTPHLQKIQADLVKEHGDARFNFHLAAHGRVYEGLGWDRIRPENEIYVNFLTAAHSVAPSSQALAAFSLLLREGVRLGKISRDYTSNVPPHTTGDYDREIRNWVAWSKKVFGEYATISLRQVYGDVNVVLRRDWGAQRRIRELDSLDNRCEVVQILRTPSSCTSYEECVLALQDLQADQFRLHSDIRANFVFAGDGRIYEGIGWDWTRGDEVLYFDFLTESDEAIPSTQRLAEFALHLREGVRLGKISEKYTVRVPSNTKEKFNSEIKKWSEWSRAIIRENTTVSMQMAEGGVNTISRFDSNPTREIVSLDHPVEVVQLTQTNCSFSMPSNCLPYVKKLHGTKIKSHQNVNSNFYFPSDDVVYEGLGWDRTTDGQKLTFEFLTPSTSALPSPRSMAASALLIGDGVRMGKISENYRLTVAKHTSVDFENEVRKWEAWSRDTLRTIVSFSL